MVERKFRTKYNENKIPTQLRDESNLFLFQRGRVILFI